MVDSIGVVTVTYNSGTVLDDFLNSTFAQSHREFTLFVIDNASRDGTLDRLRSVADSRLRVVANSENVGVAEGNNQGIRAALAMGCSFVLLLNNDTEFGADLFATMLADIKGRNADMLVPKIMFFEPKNTIWCAGGYFRPAAGYVVGHYGDGQLDSGQFDAARSLKCSPTCCMLIRSTVFERVGLMDARYFVYHDDTDFCWRALKSGISLWYDPHGVLFHKASSLTGGNESDFTISYGTRNKVYFALKHFGFLRLRYCLAVYQLIFLVKYLTGRDSRRIYAMKQKAYRDGFQLFHGT